MDFKDTDRLIGHLDRCVDFLTLSGLGLGGTFHEGIFNQGIILKERWPDLFKELVNISNSTATKEEKQEQRYLAFADTYNKPGDLEHGKFALTHTFDEQLYINFLKRNNDFYSISIEVDKIEKEFWKNCPDPKNINFLCNIYRERWIGHLYEVILEDYDWQNFLYKDKTHALYVNFKALRDCGLIQAEESELECQLVNVGQRVNFIVSGIVDFFTKMRRSGLDTNDLPEFQTEKEAQTWEVEDKPTINFNKEENKFNQEPLKTVMSHFEVLCELNCKTKGNNKPLLTRDQLEMFIKNAFILNIPLSKKITMNKGSKDQAQIVSVFHGYFSDVRRKGLYFTKTKNRKDEYIKLLTDYFAGFEFEKYMSSGLFRS